MKKLTTDQIRTELQRQGAEIPVPDAGEFWSDFKARASLRNQDQPVTAPGRRISLGLAMAAACTILILAGAGVFFLRGADSAGQELSSVKSLDVDAAHSAVLVMSDELDKSTIVWVVDMETADDDGGSGV